MTTAANKSHLGNEKKADCPGHTRATDVPRYPWGTGSGHQSSRLLYRLQQGLCTHHFSHVDSRLGD